MWTRVFGENLCSSPVPGRLIGLDLDFQKEALETLEGVMLSGTRASLSTDAKVDFLSMKVGIPAWARPLPSSDTSPTLRG
jgi:hypothetical protein